MPELTAGQSINKALSLILEKNQTAFLAGEDIGIYGGAFGVTEGLLEEFGSERIKDTPISAGLGGGSSNAAVTLKLLSKLWNVPLPPINELVLLGADIPVCMDWRLQRMQGIGCLLYTSPSPRD